MPPMAKIANVFGRFEAFSFSVFIYVIGYIQQAASSNVQTFASAQIFYSAGNTGLQILQQIFIADTSDLLNRALFSSIPDIPFLITVWVGAPIASSVLSETTWRWGYGVWAIVLPVAFLPLAISLASNLRKAKKLHTLPPSPWQGQTVVGSLKSLWYELDFFGLILLSAAVSLILIPLTLAATAKHGWKNGSIVAMLVIGCVCLVTYPFWEANPEWAPKPFLSLRLLTNRTVLTGCTIAFFYFGKPSPSPSISFQTINPQILPTFFLTSCLLYLRPTLLLLLPPSGPITIHHRSRTHHANLLLYLHRDLHLHRHPHQIHPPLQILHHPRCRHLPPRHRPHDPLPLAGQLDRVYRRHANCSRHRWRAYQRPHAARRAGERLSR